jgi:hypothetical protein
MHKQSKCPTISKTISATFFVCLFTLAHEGFMLMYPLNLGWALMFGRSSMWETLVVSVNIKGVYICIWKVPHECYQSEILFISESRFVISNSQNSNFSRLKQSSLSSSYAAVVFIFLAYLSLKFLPFRRGKVLELFMLSSRNFMKYYSSW